MSFRSSSALSFGHRRDRLVYDRLRRVFVHCPCFESAYGYACGALVGWDTQQSLPAVVAELQVLHQFCVPLIPRGGSNLELFVEYFSIHQQCKQSACLQRGHSRVDRVGDAHVRTEDAFTHEIGLDNNQRHSLVVNLERAELAGVGRPKAVGCHVECVGDGLLFHDGRAVPQIGELCVHEAFSDNIYYEILQVGCLLQTCRISITNLGENMNGTLKTILARLSTLASSLLV